MRLRTAGVGTRTSTAGTRPEPSAVGSSCWATTPWRATESMTRTCCCWWGGNTSMMRSIVCGASWVCRVAEHQVAGLGGGQRGGDGLQVAHLADEDHVGVLAQRGAQALGEARGVAAQLALVDQAPLVLVQELDRVLDGEDVLLARGVDLVDHGGQRGGLAGARGPGDEHHPAGQGGHLANDRRHAERLERLDHAGDHAERRADGAALQVGVDAHAGGPRDRVAEVDLARVLELLALGVAHDRVDDLAGVRDTQDREALQREEAAADADAGRRAGGEVDIRGAALERRQDDVREVDD